MNPQIENYRSWLRDRGFDYPLTCPVPREFEKNLHLFFDRLPLNEKEEDLLSKIMNALHINLKNTERFHIADFAEGNKTNSIYFSDQPTNSNLTQVPSLNTMLVNPTSKRVAWEKLKSLSSSYFLQGTKE